MFNPLPPEGQIFEPKFKACIAASVFDCFRRKTLRLFLHKSDRYDFMPLQKQVPKF